MVSTDAGYVQSSSPQLFAPFSAVTCTTSKSPSVVTVTSPRIVTASVAIVAMPSSCSASGGTQRHPVCGWMPTATRRVPASRA
jgi:hypothetical protein